MDFDFGGFIGQVAGDLGVGSSEDIANVVANNIGAGIASINKPVSQQAQNLPVVTPTAYVNAQAGSQKVLGISLSPNQAQILKIGGIALGAFLLYKMLRRK